MTWKRPPLTEEEKAKLRAQLAMQRADEKVNGPRVTTPKWMRFRLAKLIEDPNTSERIKGICIQSLSRIYDRERELRVERSKRKTIEAKVGRKPKAEEAKEPKSPTLTPGLAERVSRANETKQ